MTTEDLLQSALDAHPDDHTCRLVLADYLEEIGDERADGYRALGVLRRDCTYGDMYAGNTKDCPFWQYQHCPDENMTSSKGVLPKDWYTLLEFEGKYGNCCPSWSLNSKAKRRELDDAAALAFRKLPTERRAQLLSTEVLV